MHKYSLHIRSTVNPIVERYELVLKPSLRESVEITTSQTLHLPIKQFGIILGQKRLTLGETLGSF